MNPVPTTFQPGADAKDADLRSESSGGEAAPRLDLRSETPRTDAELRKYNGAIDAHFARTLERELAEAQRREKFHSDAYLQEWKENETALEKAGIDFTPDDSGGKPIITAIEELIAQRDELQRELAEARRECNRLNAEKHKIHENWVMARSLCEDGASRISELRAERDQLRADLDKTLARLAESKGQTP